VLLTVHKATCGNAELQYGTIQIKQKLVCVPRVGSNSEIKYSILEYNVRRYLRFDAINDVDNRCRYQSITQQYLKRCLIKDDISTCFGLLRPSSGFHPKVWW